MDINYVKKLVKLLSESDVDEIEIEEEGKKVRVAKHANKTMFVGQNPATTARIPEFAPAPQTPVVQPPAQAAPAVVPAPVAETKTYYEIKSPIVGTFYNAPSPDAAPFVEVGSAVQPGKILCIVEAMKLMNEIEADTTGKIVKILVQNGQPVEYGQPLFLVDKA